MPKETKQYPEPNLHEGGTFYATIPLIKGFDKVIGDVETNEEFQTGVKRYADQVTAALGLSIDRLIFDNRGLTSVSVMEGQCACIGITGDSWENRDRKLPEFSTHNIDTAEQYVALTSVVFFYLNRLQRLANQKD